MPPPHCLTLHMHTPKKRDCFFFVLFLFFSLKTEQKLRTIEAQVIKFRDVEKEKIALQSRGNKYKSEQAKFIQEQADKKVAEELEQEKQRQNCVSHFPFPCPPRPYTAHNPLLRPFFTAVCAAGGASPHNLCCWDRHHLCSSFFVSTPHHTTPHRSLPFLPTPSHPSFHKTQMCFGASPTAPPMAVCENDGCGAPAKFWCFDPSEAPKNVLLCTKTRILVGHKMAQRIQRKPQK